MASVNEIVVEQIFKQTSILEFKMPIYEYRCPNCGKKFEILRKISERNMPYLCDRCNCVADKIMSAASVIGSTKASESPPAGGAQSRPMATISNNTFIGGNVGISVPSGANVSLEGNEFHDVKKPIEFRDE